MEEVENQLLIYMSGKGKQHEILDKGANILMIIGAIMIFTVLFKVDQSPFWAEVYFMVGVIILGIGSLANILRMVKIF